MNTKQKIDKEKLKLIKDIFLNANEKNFYSLFYTLDDNLVSEDELNKFEELLEKPEFITFLENNRNSSNTRFTNTLLKFIKKFIISTKIDDILSILHVLNDEAYFKSLKTYFTPPVDYELYEIYENEIFKISEQNENLAKIYIELSNNFVLKDLKNDYFGLHPSIFVFFINQFTLALLKLKNFDETLNFFEFLVSKEIATVVRLFVVESNDESKKNEFDEKLFFTIFVYILNYYCGISKKERKFFVELLKFTNKNILTPIKDKIEKKITFIKLVNLLTYIDEASFLDFKTLVETYPINKGAANKMLWNFLFDAEKEKVFKYIRFFNSVGFIRFYNSYIYQSEILLFLLKHIFVCLAEFEIKGFPSTLMPVVMSLFMQEKINRNYIMKRKAFFDWLSTKSKSQLIESYFIKFMFYEYIFIFKKEYIEGHNIKLTRFCDDIHKVFCHIIDEKLDLAEKEESKLILYEALYKLIRTDLWKEIETKYPEHSTQIKNLCGIVESYDLDDLVFKELNFIEKEHFLLYYITIKEVVTKYTNDIEKIIPAFASDFWCRVYFDMAKFFIVNVLLPVLGNFPLYADEKNLAYTDGRNIFLPQFISYFPDNLEDLASNRNVTMFIGLALHEAGHIIAGTFKFDFKLLFLRSEIPDLYKKIYNIFEDYRIELYLIKIKAHPQVSDILYSINIFFDSKINREYDFIYILFTFMTSSAFGYYDILIKQNPLFEELVLKLFEKQRNTGRFRDIKTLAEYGIDRLKNIDIKNVFAMFLLTTEFYNIIKLWDEILIDQFLNREEKTQSYSNDRDGGEGKKILSEEDLKKLYEELNSDPKKFYEENGIPIIGSIFGEGTNVGANSKRKSLFLEEKKDLEADGLPDLNKFYEQLGTFDGPQRTKADDYGANLQKELSMVNVIRNFFGIPKPKQKPKPKRSQNKKVRILSLNKETKSKTIVNQCNIYPISAISNSFLQQHKKYDYISVKIGSMLEDLIENTNYDNYEYSSVDGELEMERLIEILVDKKNRVEPEFLEYHVETIKSLKVIIGLDISGSTAGVKLDIEKHFALIFAYALKKLTSQIDVYAFNSVTATNVYHAEPIEALTSFQSCNGNRDGDFIRFVNYLFEESNSDLKYFFLISDGQPSSTNYEGKYALDDTLLAMRECKASNVKLIYFNIDYKLQEYFNFFKNEASYAEYFSNPNDLIDAIPKLVMSIAKEIV
ncbi:MAG: hypothetical protein A2086_00705 [Spirochaetes bacterium GWD1_27_9]|nr:MAG: hypothetical protein A2Z98_03685 [Spirochaetes bacterium GWB1_27_13]OHD32530.1 MAG: hypothetical protein A2086_00705 [Spirochaetes bacterium GWD1_27_9]